MVEGGHEDTKIITTTNGHSIDGTLETLRLFIAEEDPQNKVQIVTHDGFWPKRDDLGRNRTHQSRAYAERAIGDYLWQIDIDEFYCPEDMQSILSLLYADPSITALSFWVHTFWGNPMNFLILDIYYEPFLKSFYKHQPTLNQVSYSEHWPELMNQCFGIEDFYSNNLRQHGHEVLEIVANREPLQRHWAREHSIRAAKASWGWAKKILPQKWLKRIPAMNAYLTDHCWTFIELLITLPIYFPITTKQGNYPMLKS